jgi:hypothetical protein
MWRHVQQNYHSVCVEKCLAKLSLYVETCSAKLSFCLCGEVFSKIITLCGDMFSKIIILFVWRSVQQNYHSMCLEMCSCREMFSSFHYHSLFICGTKVSYLTLSMKAKHGKNLGQQNEHGIGKLTTTDTKSRELQHNPKMDRIGIGKSIVIQSLSLQQHYRGKKKKKIHPKTGEDKSIKNPLCQFHP